MTTLEDAKMKSLKDKIASTEAPVKEESTAEKVKRVIKKVIKKK
jgi:hypothetical protein